MAQEMTERCLLPEFQTMWSESLPKSTASADGGIAGSLSKAIRKGPGLREKMVQFMRWSENVLEKTFADIIVHLGEHCVTAQMQGPGVWQVQVYDLMQNLTLKFAVSPQPGVNMCTLSDPV